MAKTIYVAVVCKDTTSLRSLRQDGDWACFLGNNRDEVIRKALKAASGWSEKNNYYRNYIVLVGKITGQAKRKTEWEFIKI